jgi:hypothetical protein
MDVDAFREGRGNSIPCFVTGWTAWDGWTACDGMGWDGMNGHVNGMGTGWEGMGPNVVGILLFHGFVLE